MSIAAANDDLEDARKVEGVILIAIRSAVLSNQRAAELVGIIWARSLALPGSQDILFNRGAYIRLCWAHMTGIT